MIYHKSTLVLVRLLFDCVIKLINCFIYLIQQLSTIRVSEQDARKNQFFFF